MRGRAGLARPAFHAAVSAALAGRAGREGRFASAVLKGKKGQRNPHFGWWGEEAEDVVRPAPSGLIVGRTFVLPYKERKNYLPASDVVSGIEFRDIVYPERKRDYEAVIALAREAREKHGIKTNPYLYELPGWFREKGREKLATLFYYIQAKALRDKGIERFSPLPKAAKPQKGR